MREIREEEISKKINFLAGKFEWVEVLVHEMRNIGGKIDLKSGQGS